MAELNAHDIKVVEFLREHGIAYPITTLQEARAAGISLSLACAFLEQESGGGHNVFGHDPVRRGQRKGGKVTKTRYALYKRLRKLGFGMQGVGPMQLTWYELQDEADAQGGCWQPRYNMRVGFRHAAAAIRTYGERDGIRRYNGSGAAAEAYAKSVLARKAQWHSRLHAAGLA